MSLTTTSLRFLAFAFGQDPIDVFPLLFPNRLIDTYEPLETIDFIPAFLACAQAYPAKITEAAEILDCLLVPNLVGVCAGLAFSRLQQLPLRHGFTLDHFIAWANLPSYDTNYCLKKAHFDQLISALQKHSYYAEVIVIS